MRFVRKLIVILALTTVFTSMASAVFATDPRPTTYPGTDQPIVAGVDAIPGQAVPVVPYLNADGSVAGTVVNPMVIPQSAPDNTMNDKTCPRSGSCQGDP